MNNYAKVLMQNLKRIRIEKELSQEEFADACDISYRLYQQIETGKGNPTLSTLAKIAISLKITLDELIQLKRLRLQKSLDEICECFRSCFKFKPYAAGLRNLNGEVLVLNDRMVDFIPNIDGKSFPIKLFDILPEQAKMILKLQLTSEQRGIATNYINFFQNEETGEETFFRAYPTILYPKKGLNPLATAAYIVPPELDNYEHYFDFCNSIIECAEH